MSGSDKPRQTEHYFSEKPTCSLRPRSINARLLGNMLTFMTGSGMFSPDKIDLGTKILIENAIHEKGWHVLDLCCGYGAVGVALGRSDPSAVITLTDINERAVSFSKQNLRANSVEGTVLCGDGFAKVPDLFDSILLNPPQSAGRKLCESLIETSIKHLAPKGVIQVVARHQKGGRMLSEFMKTVFGNVETIARQSGYRVYVSRKGCNIKDR